MSRIDEGNLQLVESQKQVDELNSDFYDRFSYPWPPERYPAFPDQEFGVTMLNQDIGCWDNGRIPARPKIWVAGCGTNQAVYTALQFPGSEILGTDIASQSLKICKNSADLLGIKNLILENKSINSTAYRDEFDYIICTGVIHHNADPKIALKKLAEALKPDGIMEVMVYNYYQTLLMAAIQKVIRIYCGTGEKIKHDEELAAVKNIMKNLQTKNFLMSEFLESFKDSPESEMANCVIQPVLHSYTIESFEQLINECNLEYLLHCINQFDKNANRLNWNLKFKDPEMTKYYESFPDSRRWQMTQLLMLNDSPMIWFYLQRKDSNFKRKSEKRICREFLETKFEKKTTTMTVYVRLQEDSYTLKSESVSYPSPSIPTDVVAKTIFKAVTPDIPMLEIFRKLKIPPSFHNVNLARVLLTTSAFPYLTAVG